jgi:transposase
MHYTYVGIDSHKDTHTAVFLDCFFEKLGEITFDNLPSKFNDFLEKAQLLRQDGTVLLFGLEDVSMYGRTLAVFLRDNAQKFKHVNALLVAKERKNQTVTEKTDAVDAECAARVLLSKFDELPDAEPMDKYWVLRTLVVRRDFVMRNNISLKNHLHTLLMHHYPNYRSFFYNIECVTSLAFFMRYPSPSTLEGITVDELAKFLRGPSNGHVGAATARKILDSLQDTTVPFQELRDSAVQSTIGQIEYNLKELSSLESTLADILAWFETTLTSMNGIDVVSAAQLLSNIGDIKRFTTPAKLARYAGISPIEYSSGKKDLLFANKRGNRELNSLFFSLANRLVMTIGSNNKVMNPFFYEYYHRKISEGKTKRQALKCVQRRLVNIIWSMLTHGEEYVNPPSYYTKEERDKV